jgi:hypothetical protein
MIRIYSRACRHGAKGLTAAFMLILLSLTVGKYSTSHAMQSNQAVQATPSAIPCRDSFEDDGIPSQAKTIVTGETQTHAFCPAGDADWLVFFGNAGKAYSIETSGLSVGVDTKLNLFAPDGRTLLSANDDALGARGPSRLTFYPTVDGWYYVQAKNLGDIGYAGLQYSISLQQVGLPTGTPTPLASPTSIPAPPGPPPPASPTQSVFVADLLHPQKGEGGVDVFTAGPADGMLPDGLEADDTRESAKSISAGAVYKYLNFVPSTPAAPDTDFYSFRAKPGLCYLVETGDLSSGLDTTILLWQAVATKEKWKLVAQNDDARPRTADLSSAVRWCASRDNNVVAEVRNYGGAVPTDPHGKSYSLSLVIDPPPPTPTRVPPTAAPQRAQAQPQPHTVGSAGGGAPSVSQQQPPTRIVQAQVTVPPVTPTPPIPDVTPAITPTPLPVTSTPAPTRVSIDVVAYIADAAATGPNPGDGIVELPVLLVDVRTNAVVQRTTTDGNGHARLEWEWQGPVRVAIPAFRWGRTLQFQDFTPDPSTNVAGTRATSELGRTLLLQARMSSYVLPGIYP